MNKASFNQPDAIKIFDRCQSTMKIPVRFIPYRIGTAAGLIQARLLPQAVVGDENTLCPGLVAMLDRFSKCTLIEPNASARNFRQLLFAHWCNGEPTHVA